MGVLDYGCEVLGVRRRSNLRGRLVFFGLFLGCLTLVRELGLPAKLDIEFELQDGNLGIRFAAGACQRRDGAAAE